MLRRGNSIISHQVRNIAECALDFSLKIRGNDEFPSEAVVVSTLNVVAKLPVIAVIGDTGSGKSTILSHLAMEPCLAMISQNEDASVDKKGERVAQKWVYSPPEIPLHNAPFSLRYFPSDVLQEVELMDTRGIDLPEVCIALPKILENVDVIVLSVLATNPDSTTCWDFIASLSPDFFGRMVIALTHTEAVSYDELQVIKDHVRGICADKLNIVLPLFPTTAVSQGRLSSPGVEAMARRIDGMLETMRPSAWHTDAVISATDVLLSEQAKVLRNQDRLTRLDAGFLAGIEYEINEMRYKMELSIPARLNAICQFVQECLPRLARKTARQLGYALSINRMHRFRHLSSIIDEWFYEMIRQGVEERIEFHNRAFLASCEDHWNGVRPRVKDQLDCEIGAFPQEDIRHQLDAYRMRLGHAVYAPINDLGLKACLTKLYVSQERWMRRQLIVILLLIIAAGVLGSLGEFVAGFVLLGCAVSLYLLSSVALIFIRMRLTTQIEDAAREMPQAVHDGLQIPLYEATVSGIVDYRKLYRTLRGLVAIGADQIEPLMKEHSLIFYKLSAMRQARR
ncbi:MAG: hypothetical protein RSA21_05350 [Akkermansia sp.]